MTLTTRSLLAATALVIGVAGAPALAETVAQLDAESRATDSAASGLSLARRQINSGALLDAMATLERVLFNYPENHEARALHAGLLCRIDDKRGALVEFDALRGLDVAQGVSDEARAPCSRR